MCAILRILCAQGRILYAIVPAGRRRGGRAAVRGKGGEGDVVRRRRRPGAAWLRTEAGLRRARGMGRLQVSVGTRYEREGRAFLVVQGICQNSEYSSVNQTWSGQKY